MFKSPSPLSEAARESIGRSLNATLAEGLDLHSQIKVAHWNVKGMHFASLHPLFETFAVALAAFNDQVAERAVTLGSKAYGTARHVAKVSSLPEYPQETTRDLEHVKLLVERIESYLVNVRKGRDARRAAEGPGHRGPPDRHHRGVREERLVPSRLARGLTRPASRLNRSPPRRTTIPSGTRPGGNE